MFYRIADEGELSLLRPWPGLPGRLRWTEQQLVLSADFPRDVAEQIARLIELLVAREDALRRQGQELAASLAHPSRELAYAAAIAHRVQRLSDHERTILPRIWRLSRRNMERLRRLSVSLGADDVTFVDDDDCVECDVFYLGI